MIAKNQSGVESQQACMISNTSFKYRYPSLCYRLHLVIVQKICHPMCQYMWMDYGLRKYYHYYTPQNDFLFNNTHCTGLLFQISLQCIDSLNWQCHRGIRKGAWPVKICSEPQDLYFIVLLTNEKLQSKRHLSCILNPKIQRHCSSCLIAWYIMSYIVTVITKNVQNFIYVTNCVHQIRRNKCEHNANNTTAWN